jgi:hypothetical protein
MVLPDFFFGDNFSDGGTARAAVNCVASLIERKEEILLELRNNCFELFARNRAHKIARIHRGLLFFGAPIFLSNAYYFNSKVCAATSRTSLNSSVAENWTLFVESNST